MGFLKPTKKKILLFIPVFILFLLVFNSLRILPCYSKPVLGPEYVVDWEITGCSLRSFNYIPPYMTLGIAVKHTIWSVLIMILFFLVVPYVLSCSLALIKKKGKI
ncbi:hypothetical protein J4438_02575 [Candidatus Woesearchaeota archaeon]|nr:hypothetical protein [Candidatus Woesearchaeota archaeon]